MPDKQQLTLNVNLKDGYRFDSFYAPENTSNDEIVRTLKAFTSSTHAAQNLLWGNKNAGKTHLLQACCAEEAMHQRIVTYIPLKLLSSSGVQILQGLNHSQLIVLDDIDTVIGNKDWEIALFNLINQTRDAKQRLLLSTQQNPRKINGALADLASRLIWGGSYQLQPLSDDEKRVALQLRAEQRGFTLSERVIEYVYRRYPRDIASLMRILDILDKESLQQKTKITVPFVKHVLK